MPHFGEFEFSVKECDLLAIQYVIRLQVHSNNLIKHHLVQQQRDISLATFIAVGQYFFNLIEICSSEPGCMDGPKTFIRIYFYFAC